MYTFQDLVKQHDRCNKLREELIKAYEAETNGDTDRTDELLIQLKEAQALRAKINETLKA